MDTNTANKDMRFPISFYHVGVGQGHHFIIAGVHFCLFHSPTSANTTRNEDDLCIKSVLLYAGKVDTVLPGFVTVTSCFEANCRGPNFRTHRSSLGAEHDWAT